jgi:hypothetical protein
MCKMNTHTSYHFRVEHEQDGVDGDHLQGY